MKTLLLIVALLISVQKSHATASLICTAKRPFSDDMRVVEFISERSGVTATVERIPELLNCFVSKDPELLVECAYTVKFPSGRVMRESRLALSRNSEKAFLTDYYAPKSIYLDVFDCKTWEKI